MFRNVNKVSVWNVEGFWWIDYNRFAEFTTQKYICSDRFKPAINILASKSEWGQNARTKSTESAGRSARKNRGRIYHMFHKNIILYIPRLFWISWFHNFIPHWVGGLGWPIPLVCWPKLLIVSTGWCHVFHARGVALFLLTSTVAPVAIAGRRHFESASGICDRDWGLW